jgi:hypothetical protein
MSVDMNSRIPVIIGVVGGVAELASLQSVFDEFRNTFRDSTPIQVMLAEASAEIKLFDAGFPQSSSRLPLSRSTENNIEQDVATYLLRNCHFVLLAATLEKSQPIRCAVEACAVEFPAGVPTVDGDNVSVFDLPEPAPVLVQLVANSLKLEIANQKVISESGNHAETASESKKRNIFSLALFEYAETAPAWKFWLGLVQEAASNYASTSGEKPFSFVRNAKDAMGRRWLDCVKAIHRQAVFNDEAWSISEVHEYQVERFGFDSQNNVPQDRDVCDLKALLLIQCKADTLASKYQTLWQKLRFATMKNLANKDGYPRRFFSFLWLGGISAFLFVFSTEFGGLLGGWSNILASLGYAIILLTTFVLYIDVRKQSWEQKHQDYRFIAEVLAIQLHWMLGGIRKYASDHFPSGIKSDVQWVRRAVHTSRFLSKVEEGKSTLAIVQVCKNWVESQSEWHEKTFQMGRENALDALNKRRGFAGKMFVGLFLIFTLFTLYEGNSMLLGGHGSPNQQKIVAHGEASKQEKVMAAHSPVVDQAEVIAHTLVEEAATPAQAHIANGHDAERWKEHLEQFHHLLVVLMVTSLVLFALLGEAIEGYGIEQELTRSESLVGVYERCLREFEKHADDSKKRKLLMEVGGFAIEAEANWLVLHRERPMQPVKGG